MLAFLALSCDSTTETSIREMPVDYLPVHAGHFQVYDVSDIRYELGVPETLAYQLKTVVTDSFVNASGAMSYVIYRSTRNTQSDTWQYLDTWSLTLNNREAVVSEENIAYLKLKFPATEGFEWNGNTYNTLADDGYKILETNAVYEYGGSTFTDCITVEQSDNDDFVVFLDQRKEVFSKHVGLIYKETTQLNYCTQTELNCIGRQYVETGLIYKQTIAGYGQE